MPRSPKPKPSVQPVSPLPPITSAEPFEVEKEPLVTVAVPTVENPPQVTVAPVEERKVLYPNVICDEYSTTSPKGPLTAKLWKIILGWEDEDQYKARMVLEKPGTKAEEHNYGEEYHCKDAYDKKVKCARNLHNRYFDIQWSKGLIHTILHGEWAGPFTVPGGTINGETVRISKYGDTISGQHQGTACILAQQYLDKARKQLGRESADKKYPTWAKTEELFIETMVIKGLSDDPKILMTVDYVKPRSVADVFYTSDLFRKSNTPERKELCRNLAGACDMLWNRTSAKGYKTHPEMVGFLERHPRLLQCVSHIYQENNASSGRRLNKINLNAGHCAALMYIMGSSGPKTDGDVYRNESPPSEKNLDWAFWQQAMDFWTLLATGKDFIPVRVALGRLIESKPQKMENMGLGGRSDEKLAILAKAWDHWKTYSGGESVFEDTDLAAGGLLCLSYTNVDDKGKTLPDGKIKLLDDDDFYGIDSPTRTDDGGGTQATEEPMPPPPTQEEIEAAMEAARKLREQAL